MCSLENELQLGKTFHRFSRSMLVYPCGHGNPQGKPKQALPGVVSQKRKKQCEFTIVYRATQKIPEKNPRKRHKNAQSSWGWMHLTHKHRFLDFSPQERAELRRYFDELSGENGKIDLEQLDAWGRAAFFQRAGSGYQSMGMSLIMDLPIENGDL